MPRIWCRPPYPPVPGGRYKQQHTQFFSPNCFLKKIGAPQSQNMLQICTSNLALIGQIVVILTLKITSFHYRDFQQIFPKKISRPLENFFSPESEILLIPKLL